MHRSENLEMQFRTGQESRAGEERSGDGGMIDRTRAFENERVRLVGIAYRMLGSVSDAEDVVQETYLRLHRAEADDIRNLPGWLTTVCGRLCLDRLKSAARTRETYIGPWLPEPLETEEMAGPDGKLESYETVSTAFLLMMERLSPVERAAFLLRDIFDYSYGEIAEILERSQSATRQTVHRARKRLRDDKPRFGVDGERREELTRAFFAALEAGDAAAFESTLSEDVEVWADGGGKATAARNVITGATAVTRFFLGLVEKGLMTLDVEYRQVNGATAAVITQDGAMFAILTVHVDPSGRVSHIFSMRNPEKMAHIARAKV